jgi:DNA repair exonuclease SbcCD ATPase subunit
MKLLKLKLHNFRSYGAADIEFSESQNYVFGRNWQGKSSLMDGIAYALFGKQAFPTRLAGTAVKVEHLVREGSEEGWVELKFEHDGATYVLKRTCPRDKPSFTCNGKEIGSSIATVKEALYELLGVDDSLFANVFYSEQDELRKVLEIKPEERKMFIETILGFEYLKELKLATKHASDSLQKWLEGFTSGNIKTIIEMSKDIESRVSEISERLKELNSEISDLGNPRKNIIEANNRAVEATQKVNGSIRASSSLKSQKEMQEETLQGIAKGVCPTCKQNIPRDLQKKLQHQFSHIIAEIESKIKTAEEELRKFNSELGRANADYSISYEKSAELEGLTSERDTLSDELGDNKKNLEKMKKELAAYGNKHLVFKRIGEERGFLDELQQAIDDFRVQLRSTMTSDLENAVNFFMSKFGDGDFDAQLRITKDFGFETLLHGHSVPLFNLSGAARDILALSIRYGLYRIASKDINFILLDEPTHHFDQANTNKLKGALNELADQQLIIITVHDELADAVGKKFMVEKDDELKSVIREI